MDHKSITRCKKKLAYWQNKIDQIHNWAIRKGYHSIPLWYDCSSTQEKLYFYKRLLKKLEMKYIHNPFKVGDYVRKGNYAFIIEGFHKNYALGIYGEIHINELCKIQPKTNIMLAQDGD